MVFLVVLAIVAIYLGAGLLTATPGAGVGWSLIVLAFPMSLIALVLINLKGTLQTRLRSVKTQIDKFIVSLDEKLTVERGAPNPDQESIETWERNRDNLEQLKTELVESYSDGRFVGSFAFMAGVYAFCFFIASVKVRPIADWGGLQATLEALPMSALAALIGAWAFALYSVIARVSTADQSPEFLLRLSYQPVIAIAVAIFGSVIFNQDFVIFIAFAVGFLPYSQIVRWIRLQAQSRIGGGSGGAAAMEGIGQDDLAELDGIGFDEIERLNEENIKNIQQLAYSNPVQVHFSTAYPLKTVIDWTDQAILRIYVSYEAYKKLKPTGIRGAIEMAQVRRRIRELERRIKDAEAAGDTKDAAELTAVKGEFLKEVALATGVSEAGVRNLAYQLSEDSQVEFVYFLYDELSRST